MQIRRNRNIVESDDAVDVEKILKFAEDFEFEAFGKIEETRIAKINIKLRRSFARIAPYADGSVGGAKTVAVEIAIADDIKCFAAVGGGDNAELVVVEKIAQHFVFKIKLRADNQTHHKSMALVGEAKSLCRERDLSGRTKPGLECFRWSYFVRARRPLLLKMCSSR